MSPGQDLLKPSDFNRWKRIIIKPIRRLVSVDVRYGNLLGRYGGSSNGVLKGDAQSRPATQKRDWQRVALFGLIALRLVA